MFQARQRLGDFEIIRPLGKGGMGEVYEAQQGNPPRRVALKVLAPWLAENNDALQRFWREAAIPAQLDHPNIVHIITTGKTDDGVAFYTMQLVRGITLAELMRRAGDAGAAPNNDRPTAGEVGPRQDTPSQAEPRPPEATPPTAAQSPPILPEYRMARYQVVARLGAVAARALASAHQHGVVHRDIKPSNIMVDSHGQLYVLDFGLTRIVGPAAQGSWLGAVRGTPWYMSPEQARGELVDARSDIYSLGVTLYELAAQGLGPYTASRQNNDAVLGQVKQGQCLPLRSLAPDVPRGLERIIQRAMQFKPGRRYDSAAEMAADLERFQSRLSSSTPSPVPTLSFAGRWSRPVGWGSALVVLVSLVTAIIIFALYPSRKAEPAPEGSQAAPGPAQAEQLQTLPPALDDLPRSGRLDLLDMHGLPRWQRELTGQGLFRSTDRPPHVQLFLLSRGSEPYMLALAQEAQARPFEFSIELMKQHLPMAGPDANRLGIFFGYRVDPEDAHASNRFFILEVAENPQTPGEGNLKIGTGRVVEQVGARQNATIWLESFRGDEGTLPLPQLPDACHSLHVRVFGEAIEISANENNPISQRRQYNLKSLREHYPRITEKLDVRGALGVWTKGGMGVFRKATYTRLEAKEKRD